jgi:hypothetical protein
MPPLLVVVVETVHELTVKAESGGAIAAATATATTAGPESITPLGAERDVR